MSYRELRNCAEMLRALGFPRLISLENFRSPNFNLVAEILTWLVQRFEPGARIPSDIDTEQDRVIFIRSIAQFMATKANVRLNTKKLYQADGFAVQETLKVLSLLYGALQINNKENKISEDDEGGTTTFNFDVSKKLNDMKQLRSLASLITGRGATLYDLLRREVDLRDIRNVTINRQLELTEVESGIQKAIKSVESEATEFQTSIENVGSDESNLEAKVEKKKTALERGQKRLQTLKKVRPAFMDEYEKLEEDLKTQYEAFTRRFMNLAYLEQQLEDQEKADTEKVAEREATRKGMEKPRGSGAPFNNLIEDDDSDDDDDDDEDDDTDDDEEDDGLATKEAGTTKPSKPRPSIPIKKSAKGPRQVFGNMNGIQDLDSESLDSEMGLNMDERPDSDMDGLESDLVRLNGGPVSLVGSKTRGQNERQDISGMSGLSQDEDDF